MKFTAGKDTMLGEPKLPAGKKYHDEYLGDVETYHDNIEAGVPYTVASGATRIQLSVRYQGCHEVEPKLCYPPHSETVDLPVPKATTTVTAAPSAPATTATTGAAKSGPARYLGSAAAQAALKEGVNAKQSGHHDEAVIKFKKAISLDPYFTKAHESYLQEQRSRPVVDFFSGPRIDSLSAEERGKGLSKVSEQVKGIAETLIREYTPLVKQYPENAAYLWALGSLYNETDIARQEKYCRQALHIDKDFAQAYQCLANIASMRNDHPQALAYQRKAMELMPDDPELAGNYVWMLKGDTATADAEIKSLLVRFPDSPGIAFALIDRAWKQKTEARRIDALEKLRKDAPASSKPVVALAAEKL
jgi:tetratricopeptide (TPR) repeat protein